MVKQYIGGKLVEGQGKPLEVYNPATGEVVGVVGSATAAQAEEALTAAQTAFKMWSKTPVAVRIEWLMRLREACMAERETFVRLISEESGRTYPLACADFDWCMTSFTFYSDEVKRVYGTQFPNLDGDGSFHVAARQPIGVVVAHLAWNYPMGNAGLKIAPSVVSGCACIIKPSSQTPLATLYLGEVVERIGFPAGVINILSGPSSEVGSTLNRSVIPKMITLIGSNETGLKIMRESATSLKKYSFELGGNAPVVVMDDADPDEVAQNLIAKKCGFAGQTCVNYNRIYVHDKLYADVAKCVQKRLKDVVPGSWKDVGNIIGPMITPEARDRMFDLIDDAVAQGAELVCGGQIPEERKNGAFITPALLVDVNDDMRVSNEEIFGPIIPLQPFKTLDEAIEKSNATQYGLSSYFFGHRAADIMKAFNGFEAGEIFINGSTGTEFSPHSGTKQSGIGVDKSFWSLEEYFDLKYLSMLP